MITQFPDERPDLLFSGHGWLNEENRRVLTNLISQLRPTMIVEVGTWLGLSARFMSDLAPQATVYCVDTWKGSREHIGVPDWERFLPTLWDQFVVDCWDHRDRLVPVVGDSLDGLFEVFMGGPPEPQLVYIDGGHDYEIVHGDIATAMELWPAAVIVGDDWGWEGPRRAATELVPPERLRVDGNCWWREP